MSSFKVIVKTLAKTQFEINVEPSETVQAVKAKIEKEHGVPVQKLIFQGKILVETDTMESCGVKENSYFVIMASKQASNTNANNATASASTPAAPAANPPAPTPVETAPVPAPQPVQQPAQQPAQPAAQTQGGLSGESAFVTGDAFEATVSNIVEMGFSRESVIAALRASFNNPDRAVDYLMSNPNFGGNTTGLGNPPEFGGNNTGLGNPQEFGGNDGEFGGNITGLGNSALEELRNHPQLNMLRQIVATRPDVLPQIIQELGRTNPGLLQAITENQDEFLSILAGEDQGDEGMADDGEDGDEANFGGNGGQNFGGNGGQNFGGNLAGNRGEVQVQVTVAERDAIERLCQLGFDRNLVLQAYFACDKDEEVTANYLFDHGADEL